MTGKSSQPRIGYVLKEFPVISETFILNEIRAMEQAGVALAVFSLKRPETHPPHLDPLELRSDIRYSRWGELGGVPYLVLAHARVFFRRPRRYLRALSREVLTSLLTCLREPGWRQRKTLSKRVRRFAWAGWLASAAREYRVRHLHAHYAGEPLRVVDLVRRLSGVSYSFSAHAKDLYTAPVTRLERRLRRADFVLACHRHGAGYLRARVRAEDANKVLLVRHGVDTSRFSTRTLAREEGLVLAVGRLTAKKGFDVLIRACALLAEDERRFRCEIVGEGALESTLQKLIDELGLRNRVTIRPFVPHSELPGLYARASVLAMPAKVLSNGNRDGVPNVVREAMACGTPVVGSRIAGLEEAVCCGRTGLLIPPEDVPALAAALARALDDPDLAASLGRAAAEELKALDYRVTNSGLAERFRSYLAPLAERALEEADRAAWEDGGIALKAAKRVGVEPHRQPAVEAAIRRAVTPGIAANDWRPDLKRLATRRLWDEVVKAGRIPRIKAALNGSGEIGGPILDLGSGRGGLSVALRAQGHQVVALDLRYRNCLVSSLRARRYGLGLRAVTSVGESLPFPDHSFQAVCCLEVLEHVRNPVALLKEIRRVMTPDGACVVTVINRRAHLDPHYHLVGVNFLPRRLANTYIRLRGRTKQSYRDCQTLDEMHYYSYRHFRALARSLGLEVVDVEEPSRRVASALHRARRWASLGFNTALVVVRPLLQPDSALADGHLSHVY